MGRRDFFSNFGLRTITPSSIMELDITGRTHLLFLFCYSVLECVLIFCCVYTSKCS